jgi:hypothetical protein
VENFAWLKRTRFPSPLLLTPKVTLPPTGEKKEELLLGSFPYKSRSPGRRRGVVIWSWKREIANV